MVEKITVVDIITLVVAISGFITAIKIITKELKRPIDTMVDNLNIKWEAVDGKIDIMGSEINEKVDHLNNKICEVDTKVDELALNVETLNIRSNKQAKDIRMSMMVNKFILNSLNGTSKEAANINKEFEEYVFNEALSEE